MDEFCKLYWQLDSTTKTNEKVAALKDYLAVAQPADAIWAIYFLIGRRIKRLVGTKHLKQWVIEQAGISDWLFAECYDRVGDLAETIALILPPPESELGLSLQQLIEQQLLPIREMEVDQQKRSVLQLWQAVDSRQAFVLGKLMMGGFRVGVSKRLAIRAISEDARN